MNQLIKITEKEGKQLVSARELHEFLESGQDFTTWIKNRIEKYGFVENEDFTLHKFMAGKAWKHDYAITVEMAKELSMVENNEKGSQARKYFIQCEKELKENVQALNTSELSPELQMFKQIFDTVAKQQIENKQMKAEIADTKDQLQEIRDVVAINTSTSNWREDCRKIIVKIAHKLGGNGFIGDINKEVYAIMRTRLKVRLIS